MLFKASRGTTISYKGRIARIGTITPERNKNTGHCVFLDKDDRCMIHSVAPFGCAYFDTHMSKAEGDKRVRRMVIDHCKPEYQTLRDELKRKAKK
jgi:Fe-S-cluster containining protein